MVLMILKVLTKCYFFFQTSGCARLGDTVSLFALALTNVLCELTACVVGLWQITFCARFSG